ncbi:MAG TPA: tetratricopeptide repeat protein [Tepidisphaeraceae bacterium]|nr:tetratricopeptide repeat protein [Tepidisphaeraceae bacterium]
MIRLLRTFSVVGLMSLAGTGCVTLDQHFSQKSHVEGARLYNAGDYEGAAGAYLNALKAEPRDYKAYYSLACCYDAEKDYEKAIHAYRTSLDVMALTFAGQHDGDFRLKVLDGLAQSIAHGATHQTELDLAEKEARTKHEAEPYFLVAKIYRYSGDADSAVENYNKAVLMDPDNVAYIRELALYYEQLGQTQRAEPALRRAYGMGADDAQMKAALRRLAIIPGPAIKPQKDLVQPVMPQGPIPDVVAPAAK